MNKLVKYKNGKRYIITVPSWDVVLNTQVAANISSNPGVTTSGSLFIIGTSAIGSAQIG